MDGNRPIYRFVSKNSQRLESNSFLILNYFTGWCMVK